MLRSVARREFPRERSTAGKKKYAGLAPSELQKLRILEEENKKLKQLVAELTLDKSKLQGVLTKKL